MPLSKSMSFGQIIKELHKGVKYPKTKAKFGAKKANAQAVAIAYRVKGKK